MTDWRRKAFLAKRVTSRLSLPRFVFSVDTVIFER